VKEEISSLFFVVERDDGIPGSLSDFTCIIVFLAGFPL